MLTQGIAISLINFRSIPQRKISSIITVIGIASVVTVIIAVLSLITGFERTMSAAGSDDIAIVLRAGSLSELNSSISFEESMIIKDKSRSGVQHSNSLSSAELYVIVDLPKRITKSQANVTLRGVQPQAFSMKNRFKIIEGRQFEPGKNELIVGRNAMRQFANLELGKTTRFGQDEWLVVGIFADNNSASESELWTDVSVLQSNFRIGDSFQSVRIKLVDNSSYNDFVDQIKADPRLNVKVQTETDYYAEQAQGLTLFIKSIGYPLAFLMGIGAIFVALNTMYVSVASRTKEIATLRAIGFYSPAVAMSTLFESMTLAMIGGITGACLAYLLFDGYQVSAMNSQSFSQVAFNFNVTYTRLMQGILWALAIGLIGGLFPAIHAARLPIIKALREL